ncbi:MAG TPA: FKBP-type peptidyl-prolyl cis-trans isomerase [Bacteroidia bacterium]|nr:FKBP-type peptidyl-prolyl cis-trans isomerase [Bacteroidia bacterium]
MKTFHAIYLAVVFFTLSSACNLTKSKQPKPEVPPADGVQRPYQSIKVSKPDTIFLTKGIKYVVTATGNGPAPKKGDWISLLFEGKLVNDSVFDASYRQGNVPLRFHLMNKEVIAGWDSVMQHLRAGDKATMVIAPEFGYGARQNGKIPPNSTLIFKVEIIDVPPKPTPWNAAGKDTITTASGLKMVLFESHPDSARPVPGQKVVVDYSGFLLNGKMVDSSIERGQPYRFQLGRGLVIRGGDEGIALMRKGEKAKLIIPYQLAYGDGGRPPVIPPKSDLVFDLHLIDFK